MSRAVQLRRLHAERDHDADGLFQVYPSAARPQFLETCAKGTGSNGGTHG